MEVNKTLIPSLYYDKKDEIAVIDSLREQLLELRGKLKQNPDYVAYIKVQGELNKIFYRWRRG